MIEKPKQTKTFAADATEENTHITPQAIERAAHISSPDSPIVESTTQEVIYNEEGFPYERLTRDTDGALLRRESFGYDGEQRLMVWQTADVDSGTHRKVIYSYTPEGTLSTVQTHTANGEISLIEIDSVSEGHSPVYSGHLIRVNGTKATYEGNPFPWVAGPQP